MNKILIIAFAFTLFSFSVCKVVTVSFNRNQLRKSPWQYISKFQSEIGKTKYVITSKFISDVEEYQDLLIPLNIEIYLDSDWNDDVADMDPCQRQSRAKISDATKVPISSEGKIQTTKGQLTQNIRPHVWFFGLTDCQGEVEKVFKAKDKVKLEITIHLTNTDDSEFSYEDRGSLELIGFLTLGNLAIIYYVVMYSLRDFRKNEEYDWPLIILIITLVFETLQNVCLFLHLLSYSGNGVGLVAFQLFSEIFQVLSSFTLTCLLIMISWGWSITFMQVDSFDIFIPLGIIIAFLQIMVMGLGKLTDDAHYKYHPFDGWVGWVISVVDSALFLYFFAGIKNTQSKSTDKVRNFINQLLAYGSVYFLGFPILLIISKIVAQYLRYKFLLVGLNALRLIAILCMTRLFTSKKSGYKEVSYKNNLSFLDRTKME